MKYSPISAKIRLTGRISKEGEQAVLCWPGSALSFCFTGTRLDLEGENDNFGCETILGAVIDGEERQYYIGGSGKVNITLAENLENKLHDAVIYKRMEGHYFTVSHIATDGELLKLPPAPEKKIEVYGDSVSAGSVVDCEEYAARPDPEHKGQYDNAWHAYPQILARTLPAQVFDTSQGGISIFDGTGWFEMPSPKGMESCWDKCRYSSYRPQSLWDFSFVPHVIIFAIGQNDANPDPDMLKKPEKREAWLKKYIEIINGTRSHAPCATIVLALTVLCHDPIWDKAMDEIALRLGGKENRVYHFMYTRVGKATPGHPRYSEQKEMAREMKAFLESLPADTWTERD